MEPAFLLFAAIVLLAFTTLAMTGFGSIVISVALGAHLYPIDDLVPLLVPLDVILTGSVALRNRTGVDWPLLARKIGPAMAAGLVVGMVIARAAPGDALRMAFGALLILLSARELY
ncbi:MAG: TSUP family transporter, partial [Candidatus Methylomirabilis sp.]|nr:TSUP family transporter [Deltaproteobacteria bacterium]